MVADARTVNREQHKMSWCVKSGQGLPFRLWGPVQSGD